MTAALSTLVARIAEGEVLTPEDIERAFALLLSGEAEPVQAGAFLTALKVRGETPQEIAAAARAMRSAATRFEGPEGAVDTCGTGGDGAHTVNISTATAIVLAACDVPVAKHGNKAVSSKSGAADVFSALGVNIEIGPEKAQACLRDIGIAFLFARDHHPAMRHVAPVRAALGFRTLFNLLGPLTNPAGAKRQLLGVYEQRLLEPIAETLRDLGAEAAWVVHGSDGLDELTVTGPSAVCALKEGRIERFPVSPEDAGLKRHPADALAGGSPEDNAEALRRLLGGQASAYRDAVVLNTAAGLLIAGRETNLSTAARLAEAAIDDGRATAKLDALIQYTTL